MTSYVPEYLKARNRKTVFDLFLHERELSRAEIVQRTKMSFPTASKAVDFRSLGLSRKELEELIVKKAGLWLDSGDIFGAAGRGFERINVACPRSVLTEALERLARAVRECVK